MSLLEGKRLLITGVLSDSSLAFGVARLAQEQGAEIVLTSVGNAMKHTVRAAKKLPEPVDIIEFDVSNPDHVASVQADLAGRWDRIDGALHAVGFAPAVCLGGTFLDAQWDDVRCVDGTVPDHAPGTDHAPRHRSRTPAPTRHLARPRTGARPGTPAPDRRVSGTMGGPDPWRSMVARRHGRPRRRTT